MEIKGNEFLNKVQEIQNEKTQEEENELSDLLLSSHEGKSDKKKYAILGILLIVLFLVTIVLIRLISNAKVSNQDLATKTQQQQKQNDAIDKKYQQIINKDLSTKKDNLVKENKLGSVENKQKPVLTKNVQSPKTTKIQKNTEPNKPKIVKKIIKKIRKHKIQSKTTASEIRRTFQNAKPSAVHGRYYIQVGAYTKAPSRRFLSHIERLGLQYKVYKKRINGILFNKLLIGPYASRAKAKSRLHKVKISLKAPHAYLTKL